MATLFKLVLVIFVGLPLAFVAFVFCAVFFGLAVGFLTALAVLVAKLVFFVVLPLMVVAWVFKRMFGRPEPTHFV